MIINFDGWLILCAQKCTGDRQKMGVQDISTNAKCGNSMADNARAAA